ncbi:MAG: hypothetical protein ACXW35_09170 [Nitrospira sp.]
MSLESCFQARMQENAEENAVWLVLWVIPCVMAIPWIGLTQTDLIFSKTIMNVERTIVGGLLSALYRVEEQAANDPDLFVFTNLSGVGAWRSTPFSAAVMWSSQNPCGKDSDSSCPKPYVKNNLW